MRATLFLSLLCAPCLFAADLGIGFKAGFSSAGAATNVEVVEQTKERRSTFHAGGLVEIGLTKHWSLQPQVLYSGKGVKFEAPDHGHIISLYSLDMPFNVIFKTQPGFFVGAGPSFGVNLRGTNEVTGDHPSTTRYEFGPNPFDFNRVDFGVNFLTGYQHAKGPFVSIGYLKGLRRGLINGPNAEWSHNALSASIGYTFRVSD